MDSPPRRRVRYSRRCSRRLTSFRAGARRRRGGARGRAALRNTSRPRGCRSSRGLDARRRVARRGPAGALDIICGARARGRPGCSRPRRRGGACGPSSPTGSSSRSSTPLKATRPSSRAFGRPRASAREEVLRNAEAITFDRPGDFSATLLHVAETLVNRRLAAIYGGPVPGAGGVGDVVERVTLPGSDAAEPSSPGGLLAPRGAPGVSPTLRGLRPRDAALQRHPDAAGQRQHRHPCALHAAPHAAPAPAAARRGRLVPRLPQLHRPAGNSRLNTSDGIGRFRATDNGVGHRRPGTLDGARTATRASSRPSSATTGSSPECIVKRANAAWGRGGDGRARRGSMPPGALRRQRVPVPRADARGGPRRQPRRAALPAAATPDGGTLKYSTDAPCCAVLGGAAVSIALLPLEAMMNRNGTAWAGGGLFRSASGSSSGQRRAARPLGARGRGRVVAALAPIPHVAKAARAPHGGVGTRVATLNTVPHGLSPRLPPPATTW